MKIPPTTLSSDLQATLEQLPRKPGVYLFRDREKNLLYIGKAKVLKNRVRSYFQKGAPATPRLLSMMTRLHDIEWIVTGSEVEALLVEANLIKEHSPKYNVNLKDDKSFPYVQITNEPYPQVLLTREVVKDGSKYFGPYTEVKSLRETLRVIHKVFPVRSCSYWIDDEVIKEKKVSVCLDYHIKKCEGPCQGLVDQDSYNRMIKEVIKFLHGRSESIIRDLREKMGAISSKMRYEEAARYRDQLRAVESFSRKQRKVTARFEDKDIVAMAVEESDACVAVIRLRNGKIVGREKMFMTGVDPDNLGEAMLGFLRQFYLETDFIPEEIIVAQEPEDQSSLEEWLQDKRGRRVRLTVPQRGEKARLLKMSHQNARLLLEEFLRQKLKRREFVPVMVQQLQEDLRLSVPPRRIEAFDVSCIQGSNPVASMVCFVDGRPRKGNYRMFKIKTVAGIDDFAMIREAVLRRYKRLKNENGKFPDLVLIDGGKGQLAMAVSALRELGLTYIPAVGLAKRLEEVYLLGYPEPQSIARGSPGLKLLRQIRDEAHRFAVTFHRRRRGKAMTSSIFDEIKGVGPVTKQRLFANYDNIRSIARASADEVSRAAKVKEPIAEEIISRAKLLLTSGNPVNTQNQGGLS